MSLKVTLLSLIVYGWIVEANDFLSKSVLPIQLFSITHETQAALVECRDAKLPTNNLLETVAKIVLRLNSDLQANKVNLRPWCN